VLCPTFGPAYCEMGQIEKFILDRPEGAAHIRKGFELAPHDSGATFVAARLEASEGNWPQAVALMRRTMILSPGMRGEILEFLVREMNRPEEALKVAEGDVQALGSLSELLENRPQDTAIAQEARRQETALLRAAAARKDCDAQTLARAARGYVSDGELNAAIECYRRALRQDYGQTRWHFELAKALANANRPDEAINELRICLIQQPNFGEAQSLLKQLLAAKDPRR
jgi:lipopolysaccharide biosynthesis regulator YciM